MPKAAQPADAQRTDSLLWFAFLLAPLAMGINTVVGYTVAHWVCDVQHKRMSFLVSAIDLLLCLISLLIGFSMRKRLAGAEDELPGMGRRRFMADMTLLFSSLGILLIIAGTIAVIILHPCD
jgi:ABC-type sulfate transport system permease subunit